MNISHKQPLSRTIKPVVSVLLALVGGATGFESSLFGAQAISATAAPETNTLRIIVVSGNAGINTIKNGTTKPPVIEVRDQHNLPVAAAVVNFESPSTGPGVSFSNGTHSISVVTETDGRAAVREMTPTGVGSFEINIAANYDGALGTAIIKQTNYATLGDAKQAGVASGDLLATSGSASTNERRLSRGAVTAIILGAAAAVGAGIALGLRHSGSSAKVGVGSPTVGAP